MKNMPERRFNLHELLTNNLPNVAASVQKEESCSYESARIVARRYIVDEFRKSARHMLLRDRIGRIGSLGVALLGGIALGKEMMTGQFVTAQQVLEQVFLLGVGIAITRMTNSSIKACKELSRDSGEIKKDDKGLESVYTQAQKRIDRRYGSTAAKSAYRPG